MHIPKTGGSAICKAMALTKVGHFSLFEREKISGPAKVIIVTVRDPISRFYSIWKYSRKDSQSKFYAPLYFLRKFSTIDGFISSGFFDAYIKRHYFFRPQSSYLEGLSVDRHQLITLQQETLKEDAKNKLGIELEYVNQSPKIEALMTKESEEKVKVFYCSDFIYLFNKRLE